jgi:hypothetical protein
MHDRESQNGSEKIRKIHLSRKSISIKWKGAFQRGKQIRRNSAIK